MRAFTLVAAFNAASGDMPYSTINSSSSAFVPCVNTPTSLPLQMVTPDASAALNIAFFCTMPAGSGSMPFFQPRYRVVLSVADNVGQNETLRCFINANTSGVAMSPCSMPSTPAMTARVMPSTVLACATTGRPLDTDVRTIAAHSSVVKVGRASPRGPHR